jgi:hypothetical protein
VAAHGWRERLRGGRAMLATTEKMLVSPAMGGGAGGGRDQQRTFVALDFHDGLMAAASADASEADHGDKVFIFDATDFKVPRKTLLVNHATPGDRPTSFILRISLITLLSSSSCYVKWPGFPR